MKAVYLKDKTGNKVVTTPYYRIGDLFLTTIADNPSSYLGGTWELFGPGRTLVCVQNSDPVINDSKKVGGSVNPLSSHKHSVSSNWMKDSGQKGLWGSAIIGVSGDTYTATPSGITINNTGDNSNHNNWQPFITCYIWIRTA